MFTGFISPDEQVAPAVKQAKLIAFSYPVQYSIGDVKLLKHPLEKNKGKKRLWTGA